MSGDSKTQKNGSRDVCRERWMCLNGKSGRRGVTGCLGSVHRDRLHSPNLSCIIRDGRVAGEFTHARRLIGTYGSSFPGPDRRGILFSGTRRMLQNQPAPYTDRRRRGRPLWDGRPQGVAPTNIRETEPLLTYHFHRHTKTDL